MAKINLSQIGKFLGNKNKHAIHIGIDVHKNSYHVAFYGDDGDTQTCVCSAEPKLLVNCLQEFSPKISRIVYEAGPTGFELARCLEAAGFTVVVVAANRVPRPVTQGAKTDRLDCIRLARYSAKDIVPGVAIPSKCQEAQRSLVRRRHDLTDGIRTVKQRIRSQLLYFSVKEPEGLNHWSDQAVKSLLTLPLSDWAKETMKSFVRELCFLKKERQYIEKQLRVVCRDRKQHGRQFENLQTIPGVGPITAATFMLELFDPHRFKRAEQVASYLGLAPMVRQSGQSRGRARLRPVGQKRLRSLLIEAAWWWSRKDVWARDKYRRIMRKTNLSQKAIVAVARDLAIILWRLSVEKRVFETRSLPAAQH